MKTPLIAPRRAMLSTTAILSMLCLAACETATRPVSVNGQVPDLADEGRCANELPDTFRNHKERALWISRAVEADDDECHSAFKNPRLWVREPWAKQTPF